MNKILFCTTRCDSYLRAPYELLKKNIKEITETTKEECQLLSVNFDNSDPKHVEARITEQIKLHLPADRLFIFIPNLSDGTSSPQRLTSPIFSAVDNLIRTGQPLPEVFLGGCDYPHRLDADYLDPDYSKIYSLNQASEEERNTLATELARGGAFIPECAKGLIANLKNWDMVESDTQQVNFLSRWINQVTKKSA
jgi:hypothetical protein